MLVKMCLLIISQKKDSSRNDWSFLLEVHTLILYFFYGSFRNASFFLFILQSVRPQCVLHFDIKNMVPHCSDKIPYYCHLPLVQICIVSIRQIKDKNYIKGLKNYSGTVLLVGINYNKSDKHHECLIETIQI